MKTSQLILLITLGSVCVVNSVHAKIYKWKDASGQTHYTQDPGPVGSQKDKLIMLNRSNDKLGSLVKKKSKVEESNKPVVKRESYKEKLNRYCAQQQENLKTLDSLRPVVWEERGKTRLLETKERKAKIIEINASLDANCP